MSINTNIESESVFSGPVFVVGISRSGTKLLRDLLNNHSQIAIPTVESKFIPIFYRTYGKLKESELQSCFPVFFKEFKKTLFYEGMASLYDENKIHPDQWLSHVKVWNYAGVIEAFFHLLAHLESSNKSIWGDKTPNYLLHLPLLKSLFPQAKFIHIIRDVRDVALSAQNAWKRNIYISAQRWFNYINKCRQDTVLFKSGEYIEVKYEELLASPKGVMTRLCGFLQVDYETGMEQLQAASEFVGDARGIKTIKANNTGKWDHALTTRQVRRIESMCAPLINNLGYPLSNDDLDQTKPYALNFFQTLYYRLKEELYNTRKSILHEGLAGAIAQIKKKIKFGLSR